MNGLAGLLRETAAPQTSGLETQIRKESNAVRLITPPLEQLWTNYYSMLRLVPPPKGHGQQTLELRERDLRGEKQTEEGSRRERPQETTASPQ